MLLMLICIVFVILTGACIYNMLDSWECLFNNWPVILTVIAWLFAGVMLLIILVHSYYCNSFINGMFL